MLRLMLALILPVPLLAQSISIRPPSVSVGPVTVTANGDAVRVSARVGGARTGRSRRSPAPAPRAPASATATRVLATADRYVGTRYQWGGTSPARGFDCSGYVQYVFGRHGVELPRTSRRQSAIGRKIALTRSGFRRGDLLFFSQGGKGVDHVAIYAGNGRIIHSSSSGGGVRYDDLSSKRGRWFAERLVGARRVIANGRSLVESLEATIEWEELAPVP